MKKEKIIVLVAIIAIIIAFYMVLDSYGRVTMALDMCANKGVWPFG